MRSSRSVTALLTKGYRNLLNLLYPRRCPLCHRILKDSRELICRECAGSLKPVSGARCFKCGKPVGEEEEYCKDCQSHPKAFDQGRGIFLYDKQMKQSIMKFKYYGCREYGRFYARAMYIYAGMEMRKWKPDVLVPVPMYWRKKRMRGFNQAEFLAQHLSLYSGIPTDSSLIKKVRETDSQKKLDAVHRRKNLQNAFEASENVKGKRILVIDDVYTTGSTMDVIAQLLREKGAESIFFLTVCIGSNR